MPTPENGHAICPFWEKSWEQNIRCEACIEHAHFIMRFSDKEKRQRHEEKYCNSYGWEKCKYAAMLQREYDEMDKK